MPRTVPPAFLRWWGRFAFNTWFSTLDPDRFIQLLACRAEDSPPPMTPADCWCSTFQTLRTLPNFASPGLARSPLSVWIQTETLWRGLVAGSQSGALWASVREGMGQSVGVSGGYRFY